MLVSIRKGVFLEPVSQIVAKETVRTVEMDVSIEKTCLIALENTNPASCCIKESREVGLCLRVKEFA